MTLLRYKRFGTLLTTCAPVRQLQFPDTKPFLTIQEARLLHTPLRCRCFTQAPNLRIVQACTPVSHGRSHSTKAHSGTGTEEDSTQPNRATQKLRECMRSIRYPVAIITSTDTAIDSNGGLESWRGLTVSSFTTVSMSPRPMVSFNVHEKSSTLEAIHNSGMFAVHLLSNTSEAVEIASRFAKPMVKDQFKQDLVGQSIYAENAIPWNISGGAETQMDSRHLPPRLQWTYSEGRDAVMLQILCKAERDLNVKVGDHVVVFGEVQHVLDSRDSKKEEHLSEHSRIRDCLTYSHGRYNVD